MENPIFLSGYNKYFRNTLTTITACLLLAACSGEESEKAKDDSPASDQEQQEQNQPPTPAFSLSPSEGPVSLVVNFDASTTTDDKDPLEALLFRWDFDGDGVWDTEYAPDPQITYTYTLSGDYSPRLGVIDEDGAVAWSVQEETISTFVAGLPPGSLIADIKVDTNRNGTLEDADDLNENTFSTASGAVYIPNLDDDDNNGERDAIDNQADVQLEIEEFSPIRLSKIDGLSADHRVTLEITPQKAADRIRLYKLQNGSLELISDLSNSLVELDNDFIGQEAQELWLEGLVGRSQYFDGEISLRLIIREGNEILSQDKAIIQASPVIFPD